MQKNNKPLKKRTGSINMEQKSYKKRSLDKRTAKKRKGFAKKVPEVVSTVVQEEENIIRTQEVGIETENNISNDTLLGDSSLHIETASSRKLKRNIIDDISDITKEFPGECTLFVDTGILISMLTEVGKCPECLDDIQVEHLMSEKKGLAHFFEMKCVKCQWEKKYCSSKEIYPKTRGQPNYEINTTAVIAFREIGHGHQAIKSFCGTMNMPAPMNLNAYIKTNNNLRGVYNNVSNGTMRQAAFETKTKILGVNTNTEDIVNIRASFDGTWQKRGYASLNGVVTAMSPEGKCLDVAVLSKICKSCQMWKGREESAGYVNWKNTHICSINHTGSSGSMEVTGVKTIYHRSIEKHRLRYTTYLGDGDTKSFAEVVKSDPYPGVTINKVECVGHVQKRVGARLRALRVEQRGKRITPELGKPYIGIGGAGKLSDRAINTLQNYYGMAIRQSTDLYSMKKGVAAVVHHCSEAKTMDERHQYCPQGPDSWCKHIVNKLNGKDITYKSKVTIPEEISIMIKPIFSYKDLGSDELLQKCLHGATQNVNESINNIIWQKCSKRIYVGLHTLELAVASAVISFNEGGMGLLAVYDKLKIKRGKYRMTYLSQKDAERVKTMNTKLSVTGKNQRKKLRTIKKGWSDKCVEKEGESYRSGAF